MDYDKRELDVLYQESPSHNGEEVSQLTIIIFVCHIIHFTGFKMTKHHESYIK